MLELILILELHIAKSAVLDLTHPKIQIPVILVQEVHFLKEIHLNVLYAKTEPILILELHIVKFVMLEGIHLKDGRVAVHALLVLIQKKVGVHAKIAYQVPMHIIQEAHIANYVVKEHMRNQVIHLIVIVVLMVHMLLKKAQLHALIVPQVHMHIIRGAPIVKFVVLDLFQKVRLKVAQIVLQEHMLLMKALLHVKFALQGIIHIILGVLIVRYAVKDLIQKLILLVARLVQVEHMLLMMAQLNA